LPLSHTNFETYPSFYDEIIKLTSITDILRTFRKHFAEAEKKGMDHNTVMDSIRPFTQELWMKLPEEEKSRFLRHLFRYFEILRSRIPPESMAIVNQMLSSGQLTIIKGRIEDITEKMNQAEIQYVTSREAKEKTVTANMVINCIGPKLDYTKVEDPLIRNLLRKGIIQPHSSHLGLNALSTGAVIGNDNDVSKTIYTLGSTMRGVLWEVLAAPEIRLQAEQLAGLLIN
jgi:uncharacterized NAD(P)/FAD-binding protein YdhS